MEIEKVRWLQISDLHIMLNSPSWEDYRDELFRFFEADPGRKPNFVVITGDYRNIRKNEPFELAEQFITELMKRLGLSSNDLFMIPGNHDTSVLNKDADGNMVIGSRYALEMQRLLPDGLTPGEHIDDGKVTDWLNKCKDDPSDYLDRLCDVTRGDTDNENAVFIPSLLSSFAKYRHMVDRMVPWYCEAKQDPTEPHSRKWEAPGGLGFNIVHLNTALVADGSRGHYQALDLLNSKKVLRGIQNGLPTLVLAHNSFYDLHPKIQDQLKQSMSAARVCAWLCGDEHIFSSDKSISCSTAGGTYSIPIYVCGKGAPDHGDDYSENGFFLYEADKQSLTLRSFQWNLEEGIREKETKTEPLADPERSVAVPKEKKRLLIGYLSCNPDVSAKDKYHLGHAYFIHSMDSRRETDHLMLLTSSYIFKPNRDICSIQREAEYAKEFVCRWEDCFDRQVRVIDIKQYLQEDSPWDETDEKLLSYISRMELRLYQKPEWVGFIKTWNDTGIIDEIAYESIMKVLKVEGSTSAYTQKEVMSFAYLLYKRPTWYSGPWLINFMHFWNFRLQSLVKDSLGLDVAPDDIFIVEARRNHYVWDAMSYCAKRFAYMNFPKVEYIENILGKDCRRPMKSSNCDNAVFLANYEESAKYSKRFSDHIREMFGAGKELNEIAMDYSARLNLED